MLLPATRERQRSISTMQHKPKQAQSLKSQVTSLEVLKVSALKVLKVSALKVFDAPSRCSTSQSSLKSQLLYIFAVYGEYTRALTLCDF